MSSPEDNSGPFKQRANVVVGTLLPQEKEKVLRGECPWCGSALIASHGRKDCTRCFGGFPSSAGAQSNAVVVNTKSSFIFEGLLEEGRGASIALRLETWEDHLFTMTKEQVQSNSVNFPCEAFTRALEAMSGEGARND